MYISGYVVPGMKLVKKHLSPYYCLLQITPNSENWLHAGFYWIYFGVSRFGVFASVADFSALHCWHNPHLIRYFSIRLLCIYMHFLLSDRVNSGRMLLPFSVSAINCLFIFVALFSIVLFAFRGKCVSSFDGENCNARKGLFYYIYLYECICAFMAPDEVHNIQ